MKKNLKKIRRKITRHIPEGVKSVLRRYIRKIKPVGNPDIPVEELKIFELLKDDMSVVFDVGAREDLLFYDIQKNCSYHLFEPNTKAVAVLKQKIASLHADNIIVNEFGLSDIDQDDCVYYEDSQSFIINPFHKGIDTGQRYSLKTLDGYVKEKNISHIDFLKIDAEGMDYKIIQGGLDTIRNKVSYIQFEYWEKAQQYVDTLGDTFNLYMLMEPRLLEAILEDVQNDTTESQKSKDYQKSLIPFDHDIVKLIDEVLAPAGYGCNILGINKKIPLSTVERLIFPVRLYDSK